MGGPIPAAIYIRTSLPTQDYSFENQSRTIREFASQHDFTIVKTYCDQGKTGLILGNKSAEFELLSDVLSRRNEYSAILVYDVSRWGRFQDNDEGAHYEFICKNSGVPVIYVANPEVNGTSALNLMLKAMRRTIAREYSRDLGNIVYAGQKRLASLGFRMGAQPGYGLRRAVVTESGLRRLEPGQRKAIANQRSVLVHGPKEEVEVVRNIFGMVTKGESPSEVVKRLNLASIPAFDGKEWTLQRVLAILRHPKYTGTIRWGSTTQRLRSLSVRTPAESWVIKKDAFSPIVDRKTFTRVQHILQKRKPTDSELITRVGQLLKREGRLGEEIIRGSDIPGKRTLSERFGSLRRLYQLVGYELEPLLVKRRTNIVSNSSLRAEVVAEICKLFPTRFSQCRLEGSRRETLILDKRVRISVSVCRWRSLNEGCGWSLTNQWAERSNLLLMCLSEPEYKGIHEYRLSLPKPKFSRTAEFREDDYWFQQTLLVATLAELPECALRLVGKTGRSHE